MTSILEWISGVRCFGVPRTGRSNLLPKSLILLNILLISSACSDTYVAGSPAALAVLPGELDFDSTRVGGSSTLILTVYETSGRSKTELRGVSLGGADAAEFSLDVSLPITVDRGGQQSFAVTWTPSRQGRSEASLTLVADRVVTQLPAIRLFGEALGPDLDGDGSSADEGDCDDTEGSVSPDGVEVCDDLDNDCDGLVDEAALDASSWYSDYDGDGIGATPVEPACSAPVGAVAASGDCDDGRADTYPGADERCDGVDNDCDGQRDEDAIDATSWYADLDGDGFSGDAAVVVACQAPSGHSSSSSDCDDQNPAIHPAAEELCNGADDDCDGIADDDPIRPPAWYLDEDGDGYGIDSDVLYQCSAAGRASQGGDCNDRDSTVHPAAPEECNGRDENCNDLIDEGVPASGWYPDADGDGFGANADPVVRCAPPDAHVARAGDCDDQDASRHPDAVEICDAIDQDCDLIVDEDLPTQRWYPDHDVDGFGGISQPIDVCYSPANHVSDSSDCDDFRADIHPGAAEICNGLDDDCNGLEDDHASDASLFYWDADGDGFGRSSSPMRSCDAPPDHVSRDGDCDDLQAQIYPGADELCNTLDDDCDGIVDEDAIDAQLWGVDADLDGYAGTDLVASCEAPADSTPIDEAHPEDCDDADSEIHPDAFEQCDGNDYDCDGIWSPKSCDGCHVGPDPETSLYPSIQEALDAARVGIDFGDTLRVCAGTYRERLRFYGVPLVVRGVEGAHQTILDGSGCPNGAAGCSTVSFLDGESSRSGLVGFTIRGGAGTPRGAFQTDGSSARVGGGILIFAASPGLTDLILTGNSAEEGAGIFVSSGSPRLERIEVTAQAQAQRGGGVFLEACSAALLDLLVQDNLALGDGGGLYLLDADGSRLERVRLLRNRASVNGGGMAAFDSDLELLELSARDNLASGQSGSGLLIEGGNIRLEQADLSYNSVAGGGDREGGGGMLLRDVSTATLQTLDLEGNDSRGYGGGLSIVGGQDVRLEDIELRYNTSATQGGGMMLVAEGSKLSVLLGNALLEANSSRFGGAVSAEGVALTVHHATLHSNSAAEFGGALYQKGGSLDWRNSLWLANSARQGAGLYLESVEGQVLNNTLERNVSRERVSGAKVLGSVLPAFINNIIAHGSDGNGDLGVDAPAGMGLLFQYNDVYGNTSGGFVPDETNLSLEPLFESVSESTSPALWDLSLRPGSPCINRGEPSDSNKDPDQSRGDIGAYGGPEADW